MILKRIAHPHVVALHEVMASRDKIFMVMELVTGGELFDRIIAEGPFKARWGGWGWGWGWGWRRRMGGWVWGVEEEWRRSPVSDGCTCSCSGHAS
jgi:serine/threonine protein kinase